MSGDKPENPQETGSSQTPRAPEAVKKPDVEPGAESKLKISNLQDSIEVERKAKIERQKTIKKDVASFKTTEGWRNLQANEGTMSGIAKNLISSTVEEKFTEYLPTIQENGLGDATNLGTLKQAAKDLIYEHYTKTGNDRETTLNYVKNELGTKLKFLFSTLKGIYDSKKYAFGKPVDCLEAFSNFADLGMISNGTLQPENLKKALVIEQSSYEKIIKGFQVSMDLEADISKLENKKKTEAVTTSEKKDALTLLQEKKIQLNATPKVEIGGPEMRQKIGEGKSPDEVVKLLYRDTIISKIPDNVDEASKEKIYNWIIRESKIFTMLTAGETQLKANEGLRLKEDGTWEKFEFPQPPTTPATPATDSETSTETSAEDISKMLKEVKTGNPTWDKLLAAIGGFFASISKMTSGMSKKGGFFGTIMGFLGLKMSTTAGEKPLEDVKKVMEEAKSAGNELPQDSEDMAKEIVKIKMDVENFKKLAMDKESLKKVTDAKKASNLSWEKFFEKQLTSEEKTSFEKDKTLTKEKIVEMLLSST